MARLTRAQQQERTRAAVLAAARTEFVERGYTAATVDGIAERAELTRGAVYSNFPGKRALYLAVLVDLVEAEGTDGAAGGAPLAGPSGPGSLADALGAFARAWLHGLPLADRAPGAGQPHPRALAGVLDDGRTRGAFARATRLQALLLALTLEARTPAGRPPERQVRRARLVLRLLDGPGASVDPALEIGDPFDVAGACAHLGGLALDDVWDPPHLPYVPPATPCREPWAPPAGPRDLITGHPVDLGRDGVITVLGVDRLDAAEEAVRAARPGDQVTVAITTTDPAEIGRLVRLRVGDLTRCLRRVFPPDALPRLRLVPDEHGLLAAAVGVPEADDGTECAVRVQQGVLIARARGRGAGLAAAAGTDPSSTATPATPSGNGAPDAGASGVSAASGGAGGHTTPSDEVPS
ncbi:TetR/AcrR family transcriptional regulator [Streptomyces sp. NPDC088789]|uniref:TetR/AcrR family transcriptional regulator n=1 Tax=Streptomyces sp. NPDC088789 TaxID=3365899 RepID=UPI003817D175